MTNKNEHNYNKSSIDELIKLLSFKRVILGLDVGTKTLGMALSDTNLIIASSLDTIIRTKLNKDLVILHDVCQKYDIETLIIGLPLNMDGSEGRKIQSVKTFASNIAKSLKIPYAFWDERMSTMAVTRTLIEADMSRKRRSEVVDKLAATYILQGALDYINSKKLRK